MGEDELRQLLGLVPDAMLMARPDGTLAFANRQAEKLLGYTADELARLPIEELVPERFRDRHAEHLAAYMADPIVRPMGGDLQLFALCQDGHEIPVDISLGPVETADGRLVAAILRDVSHRKQAEWDLRGALAEVQRLTERLTAENDYLREELQSNVNFEELVGQSQAIRLTRQQIEQVANTDANVLILGETGTGKELVARSIHQHSARRERPLIKVDCAALPGSLIESELFGYEKGAFTGANARKIGRFEVADGGTIFLDEIGELPLELQAILLRVLQEGMFWRLGSQSETRVDVRVLAATNRDLRKAMQEQRFRLDLYFRLAVFPIEVPPLRQRLEDIPLLVRHFVANKQIRLGRTIQEIPLATLERLMAYPWPGNIRELENVVERSLILSPGSTLTVESLLGTTDLPFVPPTKSESMADFERSYLLGILEECQWQIKGPGMAAERLGLNPSTLYSRMKKLGLRRP